VEKRSQDFPAQAVKSQTDRDRRIPGGIVINRCIHPLFPAFLRGLSFQLFADELRPAFVGKEMNGVLPFAAGLVGEGVQDFGFHRLFCLLISFGGNLDEFLSVFQLQLHT
jgi:hypothetical protein